MTFASPYYFFLLLLLVPYVLWHFLMKNRHQATMTVATAEPFRNAPHSWRTRIVELPFWLRAAAFTMLVAVLARPQTHTSLRSGETEGIDIMMTMDISTSMAARDIHPTRMDAAKEVALNFISNRPNDNIGLTLFGGEAFMQCPLTTDHTVLVRMFRNVGCDLQAEGIIQPGTAIGMGIATAVSHLKESKAKSRVVILLTDGENNTGEISPLMSADMAKNLGIRVYTILLGREGRQEVPVAQLPDGEVYTAQMDNTADPSTLQEIAHTTGGIFYRAQSRSSLKAVYDDIDKLEKTKLKVINHNRHYEAYQPFAWAALILLLIEALLRVSCLKRIP